MLLGSNLKSKRSRIFRRIQFICDSADRQRVACIDPAVSAQVKLLKHKPRQGFSCSAPGEGACGYKNRSNPQ